MKLFYSCMWRLFAHISTLSKVVQIPLKIFSPANQWHRLVMPGRCFILVFCFTVFSLKDARPQSPEKSGAVSGPEIKSLKIGYQIPEELWNTPLQVVNHPDGKETITLSEYKDKLIILDFWSTWCSPCIKNFPKLHALQNEFGDKIKVLAVTQEDTDKITKFFKAGAGKEHTYVHSVINDSVLSTYFPHKAVPHIAWINPDGKVLNTTQAEDITQANIQAILDNQKTQMIAKVDIDRDRPLFLSEQFSNDLQLRNYSIFAKGHYPGLPSGGNFKKTKDGAIYSRQMTNLPMMDIYFPVIYELFKINGEEFNTMRTVLEVQDSALLNLISKDNGEFETHNLYNYEMVVPEEKADSLFFYILEDLNRFSDYTATIELRNVECLVLKRISNKDKIKTKGGKPKCTFPSSPSILTNQKLKVMINMLSDVESIKLPIVDETGYTDNVDLELSGVKDIVQLKNELNRYDLDLINAKRSINMLVIKDK
ncbi:TlpA family protein disulfide reductase [Sphingobacterium multivorum]|uniref:TlpA family protein disulfide reductase n=1 Tax=Sphingobacterium multivorum TaxID=28454 RepID=UPI003DA2ACC0